jgi:hypothetical protein
MATRKGHVKEMWGWLFGAQAGGKMPYRVRQPAVKEEILGMARSRGVEPLNGRVIKLK